jgi:ceramide glucosyltransferase
VTALAGAVLAALATGLVAAHLLAGLIVLARLARATRSPTPPPSAGAPLICLLRPVCGIDTFEEETLATSFRQDWPNHEIIFCVARADDPVVPLVGRLMEHHPDRRARLLQGDDRPTGNPKLNNVVKGWVATGAEWIAMSDSNVILPPDYLSALMAEWQADTGLVSSPPVGVRGNGLWGRVECAFLNGNQARLQLAADSLGMGYAQGKTLFYRRDIIEAAGGITTLGTELAEDVATTKIVRAAGLRVRLTPSPFPQPIGRRSLRQVWSRQLRWSRVRRAGFAGLFMAEPANGPALPLLMLAGAAVLGTPGAAWAALALLPVWYAAEWAFLRRAGWMEPGEGWYNLPAWALRDALSPALWIAAFLRPGFEWRGTAMAPGQPPAPG